MVIPAAARLYGPLGVRSFPFWAGQAYFIFTSWVIWQGNRAILLWQRRRFDWFHDPVRKVLTLLAASVVYTVPVAIGLMLGWYSWAGRPADWLAIQTATLIILVCVIFITHLYETVHLIQRQRSDQALVASLERARAEAEMDSLRAQIDPHFMFNSLNTMAALIENSPREAAQFNQSLADVYRYILRHKSRELVPLQAEIDFARNYLALLELRFGSAIRVAWDVNSEVGAVPPISLQLLIENAVKHNDFTEHRPLEIRIRQEGPRLIVSNARHPRYLDRPSARLGLRNLNERYRLLADVEIEVHATTNAFTVTLPLLANSAAAAER